MAQLASVVPDVDLTGRFLVAADYDRFDRRNQPTLPIVEQSLPPGKSPESNRLRSRRSSEVDESVLKSVLDQLRDVARTNLRHQIRAMRFHSTDA